MHRFRACFFAGRDNAFDDKIASRGWRGPNWHRFVRHFHMERIPVSLGIDGNGGYPHAPRCRHDPAGNLAAVRDENFVEHRRVPKGAHSPLGNNKGARGINSTRRPGAYRLMKAEIGVPAPSGICARSRTDLGHCVRAGRTLQAARATLLPPLEARAPRSQIFRICKMAATKTLTATVRAGTGKGAARHSRREGRIPAVIYGGGDAPEPVSLDYREVNKLI